MEKIIVYGGHYGNAERYAYKLAEKTGFPVYDYKVLGDLKNVDAMLYIGSLYAGGIVGLKKTLKKAEGNFNLKLVMVTVGLSDPEMEESKKNLETAMKIALPAKYNLEENVFHIRGGIDYGKLRFIHKMMMAMLYQMVKRKSADKKTIEDQQLIETYNTTIKVDDSDKLGAIEKRFQEV
ncbi:MAG: flavodoxin domain-containing protein [Gallicola sp.]|nr:flavodoxin domain-containing protein [Gallicola sp.]